MRKTKNNVTAPSSDDVAASASASAVGVGVIPRWGMQQWSVVSGHVGCVCTASKSTKSWQSARLGGGGGVLRKPEAQVDSFVLSERVPGSVCSKIFSLCVQHLDVKLWP